MRPLRNPPSPTTSAPRVLVVEVSFDADGENAWRETIRSFGKGASDIHLCHVIDAGDREALPVDTPSARTRVLDDRCDELQIFALEKVTEFVRQSGSRVRLHVTIGELAAKLADYAVQTRADAIVIGDRSAPEPAASPIARLVAIAPCSVLVVRPPSYHHARTRPGPSPFAVSDDEEEDETSRSFPFELSATRSKDNR